MFFDVFYLFTKKGDYKCSGFNTSEDTYIDYVYAIGTCNWYEFGSSSYKITCDEDFGYIQWNYYSSNDCSGSISSTTTAYKGCYEDDGYYLDVIHCGTQPKVYTPAPTEWSADYIWYVGNNGIFYTEETFGCYSAGCSVTRKWDIVDQCIDPMITIWILENDYSFTATNGEEAHIYINDEWFGSCEPLQQDGNFEFVQCEFPLNTTLINEYINPNIKNSVQNIKITLDITDQVNCCKYNGYQLLGKVRFDCGFPVNYSFPTQIPTYPSQEPTTAPTASPTNATIDYYFQVDGKNGIYSNTQYLTCGNIGNYTYRSGCSITATWRIQGTCNNPQLAVYVLEGMFAVSLDILIFKTIY